MKNPTQQQALDYFNYDPITGEFSKDGKPTGLLDAGGYVKLRMGGNYFLAHKIAWLIHHGEWVEYPDFEIDHINGIRADNRISNIRKVTKSQNQRNASGRKNNTSGFHGVNWKPKYNKIPGDGRWVARIWDGPKHIYLGQFKTLHEAKIARLAAERALGYTVRRNEKMRMIERIKQAMRDTGVCDSMSDEDLDIAVTAVLEGMRQPSDYSLAAANKTTSAVITRNHAKEIYLSIIDASLDE